MQTTTEPRDPRAALSSDVLEGIQADMQAVARSLTQAKAHEQLLQAANVRLDRAGIVLMFKLHLSTDRSYRITDLADLLGVDAPTVTRKVQQLERLGYVAREPDPSDRRASRIALSASGREALERVMAAHRCRLVQVFAEWTNEECETFVALFSRFAAALTTEMEAHRD